MEPDNDTLILGGDFGQTAEGLAEGEGNPPPVQLDDGGDANDEADSDSDHDEAGALNGDGEHELVGSGGEGATADAGATEALFATLSKDQAKATLGRKEYKRWKQWKKAQKESKGKKSKKDKEKHKDKDKKKSSTSEGKESKSKKSKGDESKPSRSKRQRHESDVEGEADLAEAAALGVADEFAEQLRRGPRGRTLGAGPSVLVKKAREMEQLKKEAESIVQRMKAARLQDQRQVPPLARLVLRPDVLKQCQRPVLHEALVAAGFLDEIRYWLCDREKGDLAPLDLRNTALDLLLGFDLEGVSSTRKKIRAALAAKRKSDDTTDAYEGITANQLRDSRIGESLNFVRTHPNESLDNKSKATTLLERMCRTFYEEDEEEETTGGGGAKWPFMGIKDIASPFEVLKTETEKFQAACVKVDKEDPLSWYRQPPKRYPKTFISGMYDGGRKGRRGSDDD